MRDLVKLYFKENSIVNHHIASFNDFLATPDNTNSTMQRIVDEFRSSTDDSEPGIIVLDRERTGDKIIGIRIGNKTGPSGEKVPTIHIGRPTACEANGCHNENLKPMEARLRNLTYKAPVYLDFEILAKDRKDSKDEEDEEMWEEVTPTDDENTNVYIGDIPIMVKSKGCNLSKKNIEEELDKGDGHTLTQQEYEEEIVKNGEDLMDPGGYFIVGGTERVLMTFEDLAPNRVMVEYDDRYSPPIEVAKIFSLREGYRALTEVIKQKDGRIIVNTPVAKSIPLIALMKALGMESDEDIFNTIVSTPEMANIVYCNIEESFASDDEKSLKKNAAASTGYHNKEMAIKYLERNFAAGQATDYMTKKIGSILDHSLLPHLGNTEDDRIKKAIFIGRVARSVLEFSLKLRDADDKDHYANKRLKLSGDLMEDLFRAHFSGLMKELKYQIEKNLTKKKGDYSHIKIPSAIRRDHLTNKMIHSLATGNWVGGRAGVSQLLDRTSNVSACSHLRRVISPLTRSQPHFEARDLHPTQWGRLCPSETPEGQNCGLVKNAALITNVSNGTSADNVTDEIMSKFSIIRVEEMKNEDARIYVDGNLIGGCEKPIDFVNKLRSVRRSNDKIITREVNVRYNDRMNEIIINCDEGRLRRPLIIVNDGVPALTRKHIESIRDEKMTWDDAFREGILEWVDAEEEEDLFIAVDAYTVPDRCEHCNKALSPDDVDWMNPGKEGDVVLKCKYCNDTFTVPSNISKKHTHLELDPMVIVGVAAGLVPYPEHNSSPRVTLGAAMAKQALGVPSSNYRIRPDTRGHLLHYPQKPMVQTQTMEFMEYNHRPAGQNFCIAVLSYHGYNIEDALVMNKSSVERGLGRSTFMRTYRSEEHKYPGSQEDRFEIPSPDTVGVRGEEAYNQLGEDGLIQPETYVEGSDVLIGRTSPPRYLDEEADVFAQEKRRDSSVTVKSGESGFVDSVLLTENEDGAKLARIKVRDQRIPEIGDKFCSRHGQKGVVGRLVKQHDMLFTADGITPDLVVNPHGIPSRMTIAHVLEMIGGKVGAMEGRTIDGTIFSGEREESIRDGLERNGFKRTGKEVMYDGRTGHMIQTDVYTGVIFYEKLHHMVSGKMHFRSRGPVQILTRQPTEGRSRQGGLRFGEMERDCLIGHGVSMVIKDRLLDSSDGTIQYVCGNPNCGHIALVNRNGDAYCQVCGNRDNVHPVRMSYAFKLLMDELLSMGVIMRLRLVDIR